MVVGAVGVGLSIRRYNEKPGAIHHNKPGPVAAGLKPVDLVLKLDAPGSLDVEVFKRRPGMVVVEACATFAQLPRERLTQPGKAAVDRAQALVPGFGHRPLADPGGPSVEIDQDRLRPVRLVVAARQRIAALRRDSVTAALRRDRVAVLRRVLVAALGLLVLGLLVLGPAERPAVRQRPER